MSNDKQSYDSLQTNDASGSSIGRIVHQAESVGLQGSYVLECFGPAEQDRDRYVSLRDKLLAHKSRNFLTRFLTAGSIRSTQASFDSIKLERKWKEPIKNVVTTLGKNFFLDAGLAGSAYTAAWYLGLISLTGYVSVPVAADTMASHASWTEAVNYSQATRPAPAFAAASAGSKATSAAVVFSINAAGPIKGSFLTTISTKSGTTGTLLSAGLFTGGDQVVNNGDTLNATYTLNA